MVVAQVLTAHGLAGELKCRLETDFPERFQPGVRVFLVPGDREMTVQAARVEGATLLLRLAGIASREAAEELRGATVEVAIDDAVALPEGRFYIHQVVGLTVVDEAGRELGQLVEVLPTGANDVYVVRADQTELLVPAIRDVVREVNLVEKRMVVSLLPGLEPSTERPPRRVWRRSRAGRRKGQAT